MMHERIALTTEMPADVTPALYRDGMARLGAAVNIVTSDGPAGRVGFTATAVCSVTDQPPTLLVCINRTSSAFQAVTANGILAVNVLTADQQPLAALFGGKTLMEERFAGTDWQFGAIGAPLVPEAAASFECRISGHSEIGSHHVLFCTVTAVHVGERPSGLVYFARGYHTLGET